MPRFHVLPAKACETLVKPIPWRSMSLPAPPDNNHIRIGVHAHISLPDWRSNEAVIARCPQLSTVAKFFESASVK